jgi:TPR repeat protein
MYWNKKFALEQRRDILKHFCKVISERANNEQNIDVDAQVILGVLFALKGEDMLDALRWFQKAADNGSVFAQYAVGLIHLTGTTKYIFEDENETSQHYLIDIDNLEVLVTASKRYLSSPLKADEKPPFDFTKWLKDERKRLAKERKKDKMLPIEADSNSANCSKIPINHSEGVKWLEKSARGGFVEAQISLGSYYLVKDSPYFDEEKGVYWLQQAAAQNNVTALLELGKFFFEKEQMNSHIKSPHSRENSISTTATTSSISISFEYFQRAASLGDSQSLYWLGYAYHHGIGVEQNSMNALECLQSAAAKENRDAQYYLALMYRNGDGVPQDSEVSMRNVRSRTLCSLELLRIYLSRFQLF